MDDPTCEHCATPLIHTSKFGPRDDWKCGLCSDRIDPDLPHRHPFSASLDHVVPLSKGGAHTYANVQAAHLICNGRKGNRVA